MTQTDTRRTENEGRPAPDAAASPDAGKTEVLPRDGRVVLKDARAVQRERYGGIKFGSAFFGWLVALGLTVLLGILAGAVTAAVGVTGPAAAVVGLGVLVVAYYAGGYVAGRLARFDGARNGFLAWVLGVLANIALAVLAAFVSAQYDVLTRVPVPDLPTTIGDLTFSRVTVIAVAVLGTLLAAVLGGKAGEVFHRRVDRAAAEVL
jgi:hypothetical protein